MYQASYPLRDFQSALKRVAYAASKDDQRPVLQCVHIVGTQQSTRLEAADGFRAALFQTAPASGTREFEFLLDPQAIAAILKAKITKRDDPSLTIDLDEHRILIEGRPVPGAFGEGTYPDIAQIFPRHTQTTVTVSPSLLLRACKTARVFAREGSNVARLHISESALIVHASSEETGESTSLVETYAVSGPQIVIGFNVDFLIDYLKACNPEPVQILLNKPNQPGLLVDADGLQAVVMPMNIIGDPALLTPTSIKPQEAYIDTGSHIWPDCYTNRHPEPGALSGGQIPAWYAKPVPWIVDPEPRDEQPAPAPDSVFTPNPQPGAVELDITAIDALTTEGTVWKKKPVKVARLHFGYPRPDPCAPIPVKLTQPAYAS